MLSRRRRNSSRIAATGSCVPLNAATRAFCAIDVMFDVVWPWIVLNTFVTLTGAIVQPVRHPVETLGAEWLLVCRSDLSEDLVYQLTRAFFEQLPALARDHGEAALIDPEQAPAAPIPLHAGAARYYREREVLR